MYVTLKDSGLNIIIGLKKESESWAKAQKLGFKVFETQEAAKRGEIIHMLVPDEMQAEIFEEQNHGKNCFYCASDQWRHTGQRG